MSSSSHQNIKHKYSIRDFAKILGCLIGVRDDVTAITLVTFGTSLIDVFATRIASVNDPTADNSLGNVIAANAISVFLGSNTDRENFLKIKSVISGLGFPWLVASIYWQVQDPDTGFIVEAPGLEFSTTLYIILAILGMHSVSFLIY